MLHPTVLCYLKWMPEACAVINLLGFRVQSRNTEKWEPLESEVVWFLFTVSVRVAAVRANCFDSVLPMSQAKTQVWLVSESGVVTAPRLAVCKEQRLADFHTQDSRHEIRELCFTDLTVKQFDPASSSKHCTFWSERTGDRFPLTGSWEISTPCIYALTNLGPVG